MIENTWNGFFVGVIANMDTSIVSQNNLIFERVGDIVYTREVQAAPSTRVPVKKAVLDPLDDVTLWYSIRMKAKEHPALREELERIVTLYHLIDQDRENDLLWFPV